MTENKDEINPQLVNQITEDFNRVYKNLYYASKQIIKKGFSEYPIFIMTKENIDIAYGVYLYVVESDYGVKKGKIAIIK